MGQFKIPDPQQQAEAKTVRSLETTPIWVWVIVAVLVMGAAAGAWATSAQMDDKETVKDELAEVSADLVEVKDELQVAVQNLEEGAAELAQAQEDFELAMTCVDSMLDLDKSYDQSYEDCKSASEAISGSEVEGMSFTTMASQSGSATMATIGSSISAGVQQVATVLQQISDDVALGGV